MKIKNKILLLGLKWMWNNHRARVLAKKIEKYKDENRYSNAWKNNYVLKKCKKILKIYKLDLEVIGYDNLIKTPFLIIANHLSMFDPIVLVAALENKKNNEKEDIQSIFLAKEELKKNRKLIGYFKINDTFFIPRDLPKKALKIFQKFMQHVKENKKAGVIFPEGTRGKDGKINEFKSGAFKFAKEYFMPIVPTIIKYSNLDINNKNRKEKIKVKVIFEKPLKPMQFISLEKKALAQRVQKIIENKYY